MTLRNDILQGDAQAKLQSYVRRALRLMEDRDTINTDIGEVIAEAKSDGFDTKIMRKAIARQRMDSEKRTEEDALLETYEHALQGDLFSNDDTKISFHIPGADPIETTGAGLQQAADEVGSRRFRRGART